MNDHLLACSSRFIFGQGLIRDYFYRKLAPVLQTLVVSKPFVQIQWNQCQNLHLEPLFLFNQLEQDFDNLKFGFNQIWIRSSFDRSSSSVAPIRSILFANRSSSVEPSVWIFLFEFYPCIFAWVLMYAIIFFVIEFPECEACYYESLGFADHQQGK